MESEKWTHLATHCPDCGAYAGHPHGQASYGRCDGYPVRATPLGPMFVIPESENEAGGRNK